MLDISHSVIIDRPVQEVFAYAGDPTNDDQWATVVVESRKTSDGPLAKGATLVQVLRFLGKRIETECEVTDHEQDRRIAFTMVAGSNRGAHERDLPGGGRRHPRDDAHPRRQHRAVQNCKPAPAAHRKPPDGCRPGRPQGPPGDARRRRLGAGIAASSKSTHLGRRRALTDSRGRAPRSRSTTSSSPSGGRAGTGRGF